jgi:hypothetical protein
MLSVALFKHRCYRKFGVARFGELDFLILPILVFPQLLWARSSLLRGSSRGSEWRSRTQSHFYSDCSIGAR